MPVKKDSTTIPIRPKPTLLILCDAITRLPAPPVLAASEARVVVPLVLAVTLAVVLGLPVAVAVLLPLQKIAFPRTPLLCRHDERLPTDCSYERQ